MRKFITPCTIAIAIALGCTAYIAVLNYYSKAEAAELQKSLATSNAQTRASNENTKAILEQSRAQIEINRSILELLKEMSGGFQPMSDVLEDQPLRRARRISARRNKSSKLPPCRTFDRVEDFGSYEVRVQDLKCLATAERGN